MLSLGYIRACASIWRIKSDGRRQKMGSAPTYRRVLEVDRSLEDRWRHTVRGDGGHVPCVTRAKSGVPVGEQPAVPFVQGGLVVTMMMLGKQAEKYGVMVMFLSYLYRSGIYRALPNEDPYQMSFMAFTLHCKY